MDAYGADFLPGYSRPMRERVDRVPAPRERVFTSYGLLRDPAREADVMEFYRSYHEAGAEAVVRLAGEIRAASQRPLLSGTFYGYLLEAPRIQDAGYLASDMVLDCPDIDLIAGPYTYQSTNEEGQERWKSDLYDGADNWLGRARGVAGDGAFRLMVESIKRRGKLYASEVDPSTYLDSTNAWRGIGGSDSETLEGSIRVLRRDLGKVWAQGVGGWFLDFGPSHGVPTGWYGSDEIIDAMRPLIEMLGDRAGDDLTSAAEVAFLPDMKSFLATRHWLGDRPWPGQGIRYTDFVNNWFLNSQNRAVQRIGAPVDYLYRFDLTPEDVGKYRLLLFPNNFLLEPSEVDALLEMLRGSGATAVWSYAPGVLTEGGIDVSQMERLTGFEVEEIVTPGSLMIETEGSVTDADGSELPTSFGVKSPRSYHPRFAVSAGPDEVLGRWSDARGSVAFARREMDGWTSVFVGAPPIPSEWLRWLAKEAGVSLWSSRTDVVNGTRSTAMVVATSDGERTLRFPRSMRSEDGQEGETFEVALGFGEVRLFRGA